jgi:hypothetical protein
MKRNSLTHSISTKLSEAQYQALESRAYALGITPSEYARTILLNHLHNPNQHVGLRVLLALLLEEMLALRTILLNLVFSLASGEKITAETMQTWITRADSEKAIKAKKMLSGAVDDKLPEPVTKEAA